MGRIGCTINGNLDDSKFNEPIPWIGIYVAAASAACAAAMAADVMNGFRYKKFWFPSKAFSLNATTLTLLAVAIKFSVDLNTSMPQRQDQLAKVSSSAFICTVMSNLMPSLGNMENKELVMNILALMILVITAVVNICIQLGTGVIYLYWVEHAFAMVIMLVLPALLTCTALSIPTTKRYLDHKYREKVEVANKDCSGKRNESRDEHLREAMKKYWMMAYTCSPQFVISRSAICSASGVLCLLSALILVEAVVRSYLMPRTFKFCNGESDYKWSTMLVLVTQTVAVGIGSIAPVCRWVRSVNFRCVKKAEFLVEKYWIQKLLEWKEQPLSLRITSRHIRKRAHGVKDRILDIFIALQKGIVLGSKAIRFVSICFVSGFLRLRVLIKCRNGVSNNDLELESQHTACLSLSRFVIHLEGEEELVDLLMKSNCNTVDHFIGMGKKKEPKNLIQLLEKFDYGKEFRGVRDFDSEQVPSLESEEPPNCWALPLVTLTSIAIAVPDINKKAVKKLVVSVHEGLSYIKEVENNLDRERQDIRNTRKAADVVWLGIDLCKKWLDVDLHEISLQEQTGERALGRLADVAENKFKEFRENEMNGWLRENPSHWPVKALAANSMYRICKTLLLDYAAEVSDNQKLFEKLSVTIAGILRACLSNLDMAVSRKFFCRIEERAKSIRYAVFLYGKTQRLREIVDQKKGVGSAEPLKLGHIDDWHLYNKQKESKQFNECLGDGNGNTTRVSQVPADWYITVEQ